MHRIRGLIGLALLAPLIAGCVSVTSTPPTDQAVAASPSPTPTASVAPRPSNTPRAEPTDPTVSPEPDDWSAPEPIVEPLPRGAISPAKARSKVGKVAIVCGTVESAKHAKSSAGKPTFLDLGRPYPNAPLTIVIWRYERAEFAKAPDKAFLGKLVCIQGRVERYNGHAQITSQGGDVFLASEFVRWPKDAMSCVREGSRISFGCSTYLNIIQDHLWEYDNALPGHAGRDGRSVPGSS